MKEFFKKIYQNYFNVITSFFVAITFVLFLIPSITFNNLFYNPYSFFFLNGINDKSAIFFVVLILLGLCFTSSLISFKKINTYIPFFLSFLSLVIWCLSFDYVPKIYEEIGEAYVNGFITFSIINLIICSLCSLGYGVQKNPFSIKEITYFSCFVGMAIVFDFIDFFKMPTGGSVSITMLPLFLLCLKFGVFKGFIGCGIVYGLTTCLIDGYGIVTYPFDYLLGFGCLCLVGFFPYIEKIFKLKEKVVIKYLLLSLIMAVCVTFRVIFSSISSVIFYDFTFLEGFIYNSAYVYVSFAICLPIVLLLYNRKILSLRD